MNDRIHVSAFGIRHNLGPIFLPLRQPDGELVSTQVTEGEVNCRVPDIPEHVRSTFGVAGVELQDCHVVRVSGEEQDELAAALKRESVVLGCYHIGNRCIGEAEARYRDQDVKYVEEQLVLAGRLGAKTASISIHHPPVFRQLGQASLDELVPVLRHLVSVAAANGVKLVFEHQEAITSSPATLQRIFDAVGPELGFILDTGNVEPILTAVVEGFKEGRPARYVEDAEPAFRFVEAMLPHATIVHIKTFGFDQTGKQMVYDQQRAVDMIASSGFRGPITVECASFDSPQVYPAIARTIEMVRTALN